MVDNATQAFLPDYAIAPGETLSETLDALGLTQAELAERTGRPKKTINEIIKGKAAITSETALQFEQVLGVPASFWNNLEQNYRAALARIAERERLEQQRGWLTQLPVQALVRAKWVEHFADPADQVRALLAFFGVASTDAWKTIWSDWKEAAAFRQAPSFESDFGTVAAWLRKGELEARSVECEPYSAVRFKSELIKIRELTREPPSEFVPGVIARCASAGVAVCFVPELPKLRVCGATRWLTSEKALVQLTLRYRSDDHLWFTFFHEAAHILLHGKRSVFVEPHAIAAAARSDEARCREEDEANRFAGDVLIPPDNYAAFVKDHVFSVAAIKAFADDLRIAPGIVLGRLQHDKVVPFKTPLNHRLKRYFKWADD